MTRLISIYLYLNIINIQTYIGEVLISVNPYKSLSIYNDELMLKYYNKKCFEEMPHM